MPYRGYMIRACYGGDFEEILSIINDGAEAYRGVIPADCWREPYMSAGELRAAIGRGVRFCAYEEQGALAGVMAPSNWRT